MKEVVNINKIKEFRLNKGLSQVELGDILGLAKNTISQYETGERTPSIWIFKKMADYFKCTIDDLIDDEETA